MYSRQCPNIQTAEVFSIPDELQSTIVVGEGETFDGGGATYTVAPGVTWPAIEVHSGGTLKNVNLTTLYNSSEGVQVRGNNVTIQNVNTNCFRFGIRVDQSDTVLIEDCECHHSRLDGIKLRQMSTNIHIRNCNSHHNGTDPVHNGDGIDTYSGGMHVLIEDCNFSNNKGNGITIKTDAASRDEPEIYGIPTDTTVRRCVCNDNYGSGLTAYAFPLDDETIPLYEVATFEDCESKRNGYYGVLLNADQIALTNITLEDNGITGVWIGARSGEDITLTNVTGQGITDFSEHGVTVVSNYSDRLLAQGWQALWGLRETSGTTVNDITGNGFNTTYNGGVTLNATTFLDGSPAPLFDAASEVIPLPSASLNAVFNPLQGTIMGWFEVRTGTVWTDGVTRVPLSVGSDASNRVFFTKQSINNRFDASYRSGGVARNNSQISYSPSGWFCQAITWDAGADEVKFYADGVQVGPTQTYAGAWAGVLSVAFAAIGNFTGAGGPNFWDGYVSYVGLDNRAHTPAEILTAALALDLTGSSSITFNASATGSKTVTDGIPIILPAQSTTYVIPYLRTKVIV